MLYRVSNLLLLSIISQTRALHTLYILLASIVINSTVVLIAKQ
jgi:hypothetical protein